VRRKPLKTLETFVGLELGKVFLLLCPPKHHLPLGAGLRGPLLRGVLAMTKDMAERLQAILATLDDHIGVLRRFGLDGTAHMLAIAKLDLQMRLHGISDEELSALCEALETANQRARNGKVIDLASRASRKA
jgi:hypothetical protein